MVVAVDPKRGVPVVLEREKGLPKEKQTTFFLLPLTQGEADLVQQCYEDKEPTVRQTVDLFLEKLVNWSNLKDQDGCEVPFSKELAGEMLEIRDQIELGSKVIRGLDRDTAKNSSSPSDDPGASTSTRTTATANSAGSAETESSSVESTSS